MVMALNSLILCWCAVPPDTQGERQKFCHSAVSYYQWQWTLDRNRSSVIAAATFALLLQVCLTEYYNNNTNNDILQMQSRIQHCIIQPGIVGWILHQPYEFDAG